nr:uncharacterized mitochondrial protein AtMg00810-like [Tanacetum cinerariifolium]
VLSILKFLFPRRTQEEPKKIFDALKDPSWVKSMQEELLQFKIQNVWILVDCPKGMDVKSAFLYGTINEEIYVIQPSGFQDPNFLERVYKVGMAMYGLHQAPRAWYENPWGKDRPGKDVELHLHRFMIGSLMYLTTSRPDIMFAVCDCARHQVTPKEYHLHAVKRIFRYLKGHLKLGLWYSKESPFNLVASSDSDYGGATQDRKSTIEGCHFLERRLISWQCKKQTIMATSTIEAEYVAAASGCGQVLWIQNQMLNYGEFSSNIATAVVCLATNRVYNFSKMIFDGMGEGSANPTEPHHTPSPQKHHSPQHDSPHPSHQTILSEPIPQAPTETLTPRRYTRRAIRIAQSKSLSPVDRENIAKTFALPYESSPRVPSLDVDEGSMKQRIHELMDLYSSLQRQQSQMVAKIKDQDLEISGLKARVKSLEDKDRRCAEPTQEDAPITGGIINIGDEFGAKKSTKKGSNDTKEMINVLSSMEAANILSSGGLAASVSPVDVLPAAGVPTVS